MNHYPHTTAGSIILLAAAIMFTGAAFGTGDSALALLTMAIVFSLGGLRLIWSRENSEK
jgi:hypothetical protein